MGTVINGTGKPRVVVTYNDSSTATIDLPYCQRLRERPVLLQGIHQLVDDSIEVDRRGVRIRFSLDYSRLIDGAVVLTLAPLFRLDVASIQLIPRLDNAGRAFQVYLANVGEIERAFNAGHRGVLLEFETTDVLYDYALGDSQTFGSWWDE